MKALVTGGTGTLGRLVVPRLQDAGCDVRVLSRHGRDGGGDIEFLTGDLASGVGVQAAVQGAEIIIHCAGTKEGDEDKARHLVQAAFRAGTQHLVYISVVGADRIPISSGIDRAMFGYFESKLAAERVVADSGLPWTTLRVTQLQESMLMLVQQMARLPVVPVPAGWRFQPIDAGEVAARLVELAVGTASGVVPDLAGPRVYDMVGPHVPPHLRQAPADRAGLASGQGQPRLSGGLQPSSRPCRPRPYLGGLPRRSASRQDGRWRRF
jgi:uncharacterized protein YbjT (DUF2867 family)